MAAINVRRLNDDVVRRLKHRASANNRSLEGEVRRGQIEHDEAIAMMAAVPGMPVQWNADETVGADAIRIARALDRPVYGFMYLALAHRIDAIVVTADRRFANAAAPTEHGGAVMTLADYASGG